MMIKIVLLVVALFTAIATASEVAPPTVPLPAEWTTANKSMSDMYKTATEASEGVLAAAGSDKAKKEQAAKAIFKQMVIMGEVLAKAKETGDEKKLIAMVFLYKLASTAVIKALPAKKLQVMEDEFYALAMPNPTECPDIDKPYCEAIFKVRDAIREAHSAAVDKVQAERAITEIRHDVETTMNKAYFEDRKRFPEVLAAYNKASDAVIAAAPAEKLKVMEIAFAVAITQAQSTEKH